MSIYEKTNVARALLYWAKNNNGNKAYYLEDRMYAVADNGKARHTQVNQYGDNATHIEHIGTLNL